MNNYEVRVNQEDQTFLIGVVEADSFTVTEGQLWFNQKKEKSKPWEVVAVYAANTWHSVTLVETKTVPEAKEGKHRKYSNADGEDVPLWDTEQMP